MGEKLPYPFFVVRNDHLDTKEMRIIILALSLLLTACEMEEFEKGLLKDLKEEKQYDKGKIVFNIQSYYYLHSAPITPIQPQFANAFFQQFPTIPMLGFNDYLSSYTTAFKFTTNITSFMQNPGVFTPEPYRPDDNLVFSTRSNSHFTRNKQPLAPAPLYEETESQVFKTQIAKNGDIVIYQELHSGTSRVETHIQCAQMPVVSFIELCNTGNIILDYLQIEMLDPVVLFHSPSFPTPKEIPIFIIRKNIFGDTEVDSITPSTFLPPESFNDTIFDIPVHMNLKDIGIVASKHFDFNKMQFTFHIKIKN